METLVLEGYDPVSVEYTPRLLDSGLGGEYEQRLPDGINHNLQKWTVLAEKRGQVEVESLYTFFVTHRGYLSFEWTPPGYAVPKKFICRDYSRTLVNYTVVQTVTAVLEEVPM